MIIRKAESEDLISLLAVVEEAFGEHEGPEVVGLVKDLLNDPTAYPLLSLIAENDDHRILGHILFSRAGFDDKPEVKASCLSPLAVAPDMQNRGIGQALINEGLAMLRTMDVELVFVLGHPAYYPRCSFVIAGELGFETPYPLAEEAKEAWMVYELKPGALKKTKGKVIFADALLDPRYWRE